MSNEINWTHSTQERNINMHKILAGITENQIPFGRPKYRWEDNIKMLLKEMRHVNVD